MTDVILALDFGGTKLSAAVAERAVFRSGAPRRWLAHGRRVSPPEPSAQTDIATMIALGEELLAGRPAAAVGISFGGPVDFDSGVVRLSHHVPGWEQVSLQAQISAAFSVPALVDNDANVAALGEWRFGAGQGAADLLYITVSTGVGGGWILDGRPFRGHAGMAGEIGHTVIDPQGPRCLCGKRGCVERLASGPYMARDLTALRIGDEQAPSLTGKDVAQLAAQGDEAAVAILRRGARGLGVGIGNAANLINPQRVVLGGGVTKSGPHWWQWVRQAAVETALPEVQIEIVPARFTDDAPLWGAVALMEKASAG